MAFPLILITTFIYIQVLLDTQVYAPLTVPKDLVTLLKIKNLLLSSP